MKTVMLMIAMSTLVTIANAQEAQPQPTQPNTAQRPAKQPIDAKTRAMNITNRMVKELGLTEDVKIKVYDVNFSSAKKINELREKFLNDKKAMRTELRKARQERNAQLKSIFNADQYAKWEQYKKNHKRNKEHHGTRSSIPVDINQPGNKQDNAN